MALITSHAWFNNISIFLWIYQCADGQPLILHPLNMKCMLQHYGSHENFPPRFFYIRECLFMIWRLFNLSLKFSYLASWVNAILLMQCFKSYLIFLRYWMYTFPFRLRAKIVEMEGQIQTESTRKRYRYLSHLPLTTNFWVKVVILGGF